MRFDDIAHPWPKHWLEVDAVRICYVVRPAAGESRRTVLLIPPLGRGLMHYRWSRELFLRRLGRAAWRRALERMFHDRNHPALAANFELAMKLRAGPDWPDYLTALAHTTRVAMLERPHELIESLRERRPPVLAVWGACDRITPVAWGRELARRLDAPLAIIDQAGHFPNIERPDAFEDVVLRFVHECLV